MAITKRKHGAYEFGLVVKIVTLVSATQEMLLVVSKDSLSDSDDYRLDSLYTRLEDRK